KSDMLASSTLDAMLSRRRELDVALVPDQGSPAAANRGEADKANCSFCRILRCLQPTLTGRNGTGRRGDRISTDFLRCVRSLTARGPMSASCRSRGAE